MSSNYQKFNTEVSNNTITNAEVNNIRSGSANNLFEDFKVLTQRVDLLEKRFEELSKSCPHKPNTNANANVNANANTYRN